MSKFLNILIIVGIILFPFQNLCFTFFSSTYDYSAFFFAFYCLFINFSIRNKSSFFTCIDKDYLLFFLIFMIFQLLIWTFNEIPFYRLFSGFFWSIGLFSILIFRHKIHLNIITVFYLLILSVLTISFIMLYEFFILSIQRPKAFFSETSSAALTMFATSFGFIGCYLNKKSVDFKNIHFLLLSIFFLIIGSLTKSLHLVTYFLVLNVYLFFYSKKFFLIFNISIIIIYYFFIPNYFAYSYINSLLSRLTTDQYNISFLTWFYGMDQAIFAMLNNPITGFGLGSTGFIDFYSSNNNLLESLNFSNQNRFDAYSLFFRFLIELGFFITFTLILFLLKCFKSLVDTPKEHYSIQKNALIFLKFFSLAIVTGLLIKEPVYSRSVCYLGFFLLGLSFKKVKFI